MRYMAVGSLASARIASWTLDTVVPSDQCSISAPNGVGTEGSILDISPKTASTPMSKK